MLFSKGEIPDLNKALLDAIIGALDAHQLMSTQALNSEEVREGILDILLNHTHWSSPDFVDRSQGFTKSIVGVAARHCS